MPEAPRTKSNPIVLAIDIGGSHVKLKLSNSDEVLRDDSGLQFTPEAMMAIIKRLTEGKPFDLVSMGYPGPIIHNRILAEPHNLGPGWVKFDFEKAFGKPLKIVNDALMQAIGSYNGGRMLFLGLGTGMGAAMIAENVAQPMELAHLPYKKGKTFEDYAGERGLEKYGKKKWRKNIFDIVEHITAALEPDEIVIGGGNVVKLDELPPKCRAGSNANAFIGGFRVWQDKDLRV
ncbi:ROK family protein [Aestuariivirga litoralis]|uniref:ROK family protein n=1 Tax=Aestuariivirga litoralis TaxID=2650924 RepID=UPI0018C47378|nr:ROK family protein [Aestuariivirga litoralis]MBG1233277.1 ROK family protein [Aestuariivirga litoralis]